MREIQEHLERQLTVVQTECTKLRLENRELRERVHAENTETISRWAEATFGTAGSNARCVARANEEMAELLTKVTTFADGEADEATALECADVVIVLHRVAYRCGFDLYAMVDRKMAVNRRRKWKIDGSGHGYHIGEATK